MNASPSARLGLTDQLRRDWYLTRFLFAMQDYPGKEYKRVRADLRTDLDAAAADVGMRRALADLGSPRHLADGYYGALDRERPRYWDGAVVAALLGTMLAYCFLSYGAGAVDTLLAQGGGTVQLHYLGAPLTVTGTERELGLEFKFSWLGALVYLGTMAVGFALGSRLWRLRTGRSAGA